MFEGLITVGRAELWIAFGLLSVCMFVLGVSVGQIVHMMRHPVGSTGKHRAARGTDDALRRHNSALDAVDRTLSGIRWPEADRDV